MSSASNRDVVLSDRAREWRTAMLESICDVIEPWAHGAIYRANRYPSYFDYNLVRVQDRAPVGAAEMLAIADRALAALTHRTIEFDFLDNAAPLRHELAARGWRATRLVWLFHAGGSSGSRQAPGEGVEEVPYDAVGHLRLQWHHEDFPGSDPTAFHALAREVALDHGARVFAASRDGTPVAFAQIIELGARMEIEQVYVHHAHRGQGLGTAVTSGAIRAAAGAEELWICADDEARAKDLYTRLGFRPAWATMQFLRMPSSGAI